MGGIGSGRKFRWKAEIMPKQQDLAAIFPEDFIVFGDSPEKLITQLKKLKHSIWYLAETVTLSRCKGSKDEEFKKFLEKLGVSKKCFLDLKAMAKEATEWES